MRRLVTATFLFSVALLCFAQQSKPPALNDAVRAYITQHRQDILREFEEFLAIPNVASDRDNIEKNAEALSAMLKKRGLAVQLLKVENAPPVVIAALPVDRSKHTITFYAHYDGQPVNK